MAALNIQISKFWKIVVDESYKNGNISCSKLKIWILQNPEINNVAHSNNFVVDLLVSSVDNESVFVREHEHGNNKRNPSRIEVAYRESDVGESHAMCKSRFVHVKEMVYTMPNFKPHWQRKRLNSIGGSVFNEASTRAVGDCTLTETCKIIVGGGQLTAVPTSGLYNVRTRSLVVGSLKAVVSCSYDENLLPSTPLPRFHRLSRRMQENRLC